MSALQLKAYSSGCTALRSINHAEHQRGALLEDAAGCKALLEDGAAVGCTETPTPLYIGVFRSRSACRSFASRPVSYFSTSSCSQGFNFSQSPSFALCDTSFPFPMRHCALQICLLKRWWSLAFFLDCWTAAWYSGLSICTRRSSIHVMILAGCAALSDVVALH